MELNYFAIFFATLTQFGIGAIWYTFLFGQLWGKIHGFDKLTKDVQQKMMRSMGPIYGVQFLVTLVTSFVLALFIEGLPYWNTFGIAAFLWLGFTLPAQISAVIFGGTESKWLVKKVLIQAGGSLACILGAAAVLVMFK